jgi:hypothetical protein
LGTSSTLADLLTDYQQVAAATMVNLAGNDSRHHPRDFAAALA